MREVRSGSQSFLGLSHIRLSRGRCNGLMNDFATLADDNGRDSFASPAMASRQAAGGRREPAAPQVVEILVDRGYRPAQSVAFADAPVRIVFRRRDADHCTERVVFSSPHMERRLEPHGTTLVDLPAQPSGTVRFTCGMGRYRGEIELVDRGRVSFARSGSVRLAAAAVASMVLLTALGAIPVYVAAALAAAAILANLSRRRLAAFASSSRR
jgi:Cupredoxin-like domain